MDAENQAAARTHSDHGCWVLVRCFFHVFVKMRQLPDNAKTEMPWSSG